MFQLPERGPPLEPVPGELVTRATGAGGETGARGEETKDFKAQEGHWNEKRLHPYTSRGRADPACPLVAVPLAQ